MYGFMYLIVLSEQPPCLNSQSAEGWCFCPTVGNFNRTVTSLKCLQDFFLCHTFSQQQRVRRPRLRDGVMWAEALHTGGLCARLPFTLTFFCGPLAVFVHKHSHSAVLSGRAPAGLIISDTSIKLLLRSKSSMNHPPRNLSSINSA